IRDYKVTGVQTCALPISARQELLGWKAVYQAESHPVAPVLGIDDELRRFLAMSYAIGCREHIAARKPPKSEVSGCGNPGRARLRSEERRVGKEWGSGGAA